MATVVRVRRLANPRVAGSVRRRNRPTRSTSTRKRHVHRRRMTAKQIRHFGTKAQRAALRRRTSGKRSAASAPRKRSTASAPRKRSRNRRRVVNRHRRTSNPALVLTLGAVNPRRKKVALRKHRKSNPRRRVVARKGRVQGRRRNRTRIVVRHRRRNPTLFGAQVTTTDMAKAILGGLIGVTAAKMVPPMLPGQLVSSPALRVLATVAASFAAGWAATKAVGRPFGDAVLFGGLMQSGSLALNAFLPSVGRQIGLSGGVGELMDGRFLLPQNPLRPPYGLPAPPMVAPAGARVTVNGLARAFGSAF